MSQVSKIFRRAPGCYMHWCPGCEEMHPLPDSWTFNGDLNKPTFSPSFLQGGCGKDYKGSCHYFITDGNIAYCGDNKHEYNGKTIPIPELPEWCRSKPFVEKDDQFYCDLEDVPLKE